MGHVRRVLVFGAFALILVLGIDKARAQEETATPTAPQTATSTFEPTQGGSTPTDTEIASETPTPDSSATPTPTASPTGEPSPTADVILPRDSPSITGDDLEAIPIGGYGNSFTSNVGQADEAIRFMAQAVDMSLLFTSNSLTLVLPPPTSAMASLAQMEGLATPLPAFDPFEDDAPITPPVDESVIVEAQFLGTNPDVVPVGTDKLTIQYGMYLGGALARSFEAIPLFETIHYEDLYPGIDLDYLFDDDMNVKSVFTVDPGADLAAIRIRYLGVESVALDESGGLTVSTAAGEVHETRPVAFQLVGGSKAEVLVAFQVEGGVVGFTPGQEYDSALPLVIDPSLSYSTYLGEPGADIATDVGLPDWCPYYVCEPDPSLSFEDAWTSYVVGTTDAGPFGSTDVYVTRMRSEGKEVLTNALEVNQFTANERVFRRYVGSAGEDRSRGIAVDPEGSAYMVGRTLTTDTNAFVAKVDKEGHEVFKMDFGDVDQYDEAWDIAYDGRGPSLWVVGTTSSDGLATSDAYQRAPGGAFDAFLARLDARTGAILYFTYLGASGGLFSRDESARSVVILPDGSIVIIGSTDSPEFLQSEAGSNFYQAEYGGGTDAFFARFDSSGREVISWSFIGGSGGDHGLVASTDPSGNILVGGSMSSREIPGSEGAIQPSHAGGTYDGFLARFTRPGLLDDFTYLGGSGEQDGINGVSADITGSIYLGGYTSSDFTSGTHFPTSADAYQSEPGDGTLDGFFTELGSGLELQYSTYLGGSGVDSSSSLAIWRGRAYLVGRTTSGDFPRVVPYQAGLGGAEDGFLTRFGRSWTRSAYVDNQDLYSIALFGYDVAKESSNGVVILDFGAPDWRGAPPSRRYGATEFGHGFIPIYTADPGDVDIEQMLKSFIILWWFSATGNGTRAFTNSKVTVAIGPSNCCTVREDGMPPEHGAAWAEMVSRLRDWVDERGYAGVTIAGALDAQLAWNDGGSTGEWIDAYFKWFDDNGVPRVILYDFGSCEGCQKALFANGEVNPDWGSGGPWTIAQAWYKAFGAGLNEPIPEVYTPSGSNAFQWHVLSRYSAELSSLRRPIIFAGALTECQSAVCPGPKGIPPDEGWWQLFEALLASSRTRTASVPWLTDIDWLSILSPPFCADC